MPSYWVRVFTSMIAVAAAAQGVALLHERIGHVSLAGIGLMAVGGWIGLRVSHGTGLPFEVSLLAAAGGTAGIAMLLGLPAIRHKGLIFARKRTVPTSFTALSSWLWPLWPPLLCSNQRRAALGQ